MSTTEFEPTDLDQDLTVTEEINDPDSTGDENVEFDTNPTIRSRPSKSERVGSFDIGEGRQSSSSVAERLSVADPERRKSSAGEERKSDAGEDRRDSLEGAAELMVERDQEFEETVENRRSITREGSETVIEEGQVPIDTEERRKPSDTNHAYELLSNAEETMMSNQGESTNEAQEGEGRDGFDDYYGETELQVAEEVAEKQSSAGKAHKSGAGERLPYSLKEGAAVRSSMASRKSSAAGEQRRKSSDAILGERGQSSSSVADPERRESSAGKERKSDTREERRDSLKEGAAERSLKASRKSSDAGEQRRKSSDANLREGRQSSSSVAYPERRESSARRQRKSDAGEEMRDSLEETDRFLKTRRKSSDAAEQRDSLVEEEQRMSVATSERRMSSASRKSGSTTDKEPPPEGDNQTPEETETVIEQDQAPVGTGERQASSGTSNENELLSKAEETRVSCKACVAVTSEREVPHEHSSETESHLSAKELASKRKSTLSRKQASFLHQDEFKSLMGEIYDEPYDPKISLPDIDDEDEMFKSAARSKSRDRPASFGRAQSTGQRNSQNTSEYQADENYRKSWLRAQEGRKSSQEIQTPSSTSTVRSRTGSDVPSRFQQSSNTTEDMPRTSKDSARKSWLRAQEEGRKSSPTEEIQEPSSTSMVRSRTGSDSPGSSQQSSNITEDMFKITKVSARKAVPSKKNNSRTNNDCILMTVLEPFCQVGSVPFFLASLFFFSLFLCAVPGLLDSRIFTYPPDASSMLQQQREQMVPQQREQMALQKREQMVPPQREQMVPQERLHVLSQQREQMVPQQREHMVSQQREQMVPQQREQMVSQQREQMVSQQREQVVAQREQMLPEQREQMVAQQREQGERGEQWKQGEQGKQANQWERGKSFSRNTYPEVEDPCGQAYVERHRPWELLNKDLRLSKHPDTCCKGYNCPQEQAKETLGEQGRP